MRLLSKTGFYYLLLTLFLFLAGGCLFYLHISSLLDEEINEQLYIRKDRILSYINSHHDLPVISPLDDNKLEIQPVRTRVTEQIKDTFLLSPLKDEYLPYRWVLFPVELSGQSFAASMYFPLIEKDDVLQAILVSFAWLTIALVILLFIMSRWLTAFLWKPFHQTLHQLQHADIKENPFFHPANIKEFNELHLELNRLFDRIRRQYQNLKGFTENASHEMQTPLAITQNQLEWLLQSDQLKEEELKIIRESYESTHRLTKILQTLLLLSKIENFQFDQNNNLSLLALLHKGMTWFEELKTYKNISVDEENIHDVVIRMDEYLAEIMISNLLGNAFKYCPANGKIILSCDHNTCTISNSGPPLAMAEEKLFERFSKGNVSSDSNGLGLAIVRQICECYGFHITYSYQSGYHTFSIQFQGRF